MARLEIRLVFWLAVAVYGLFRLWAIPTDASGSGGFLHDSAYISIVADEVRAGHGMVNPASWLVFLDPKSLPMSFHNANPGYPLLVSAVSAVLQCDAPRAGLIISVLSQILLIGGVYFLIAAYTPNWGLPAVGSVAVAFFPANFIDSAFVFPDALSTALSVWAIGAAVRKQWTWAPWLCGALLGGAWLVRSSATLVWPALLWWMFHSLGRRKGLRYAASALLAFVLVISPWLVYTYRVWGSPFRSDALYYLFQNYHARDLGGDVSRYWRSFQVPPSLGQILKSDPVGFARFYLRQIPVMGYMLLANLTDWSKIYLVPLFGLILLGLPAAKRYWRTAEFQAGLLLVAGTIAVLTIRAASVELRYLGPALIMALLPAVISCEALFKPAAGARDRAIAVAALACFVGMALHDRKLFKDEVAVAAPHNGSH